MTSESPQDLCPSPPADKVHITITRGQLSTLASLLDSYYHSRLPKISDIYSTEIESTNEFINAFVTFTKTDDRLATLLAETLLEDEGFANIILRISRDDFAEKFGVLNPDFKEGISKAIREIEMGVKQLRSEAQEYKKLVTVQSPPWPSNCGAGRPDRWATIARYR